MLAVSNGTPLNIEEITVKVTAYDAKNQALAIEKPYCLTHRFQAFWPDSPLSNG